MKRELFIHFAFWFSFFVLISIFKNYLSLAFWPFWLGGVVGTALPDVDHLIYVLFLNPQDLTSQRVKYLLGKRNLRRVLSLLYETRSERKNLVFHTFLFQVIFLVFTFFILTSSASIFVRGLVLAFSIHILVDQLADLVEIKSLNNWGELFSQKLNDRRSCIYFLSAVLVLIFIMIFLM